MGATPLKVPPTHAAGSETIVYFVRKTHQPTYKTAVVSIGFNLALISPCARCSVAMVKAPSYSHPLDALTADEIKACSEACTQYSEDQQLGSLRFNVVSLKVQNIDPLDLYLLLKLPSALVTSAQDSHAIFSVQQHGPFRNLPKLSCLLTRLTTTRFLTEKPTALCKHFPSPQSMKCFWISLVRRLQSYPGTR